MKKITVTLLIAGMCFLGPSPAFARPDNDGDFQRTMNEFFGGIGRSLDAAGQGFARVFGNKPDSD